MAVVSTNFNDDILFNIFNRLRLKDAARCSVLNRSLYAMVSGPAFARNRATMVGPIIMHFSAYESRAISRIPAPQPKSVITENWFKVLDSCNGILLLGHTTRIFVYNPVSGGITFVGIVQSPNTRNQFVGLLGLAVSESGIKIVNICMTELYLQVFLVSLSATGDRAINSKFSAKILREGFNLSSERNHYPVYAYGCVHWIEHNGERIFSYDVETEHSRLVPGPLNGSTTPNPIAHMWFGSGDNKLHFVLNQPDRIMLYSHNHIRNEWQLTKVIKSVELNPNAEICSVDVYQKTVYYDGRSLFQMVREKNGRGGVLLYNPMHDEWKEVGEIGWWADHNQRFIHYSATLVRVSGMYVGKSLGRRWLKLQEDCQKLQELLEC